MPPVGLAIAGSALSSFVAGSPFSLGAAFLAVGKSLAISALQKAISPKQKSRDVGNVDGGITKQVKEPLPVRRVVYGMQRMAGALAYIGTTESQKYLHQVWIIASHEVDGLQEVWFDDEPIYLDQIDGTGMVTAGRFANRARIVFHNGADDQVADPLMVTEISEWSSNHRLRGVAYAYVRIEFDRDKYPSGDPNMTFTIRGKKCFDTRTDTTVFTTNPTIISYDYMTNQRIGLNIPSAKIDDAELIASANVCDEFITTQSLTMTATAISTTTDIISCGTGDLLFQLGDRITVASTGTIPSGLLVATNYYVIPYSIKGSARFRLASTYENAFWGTYIDITSAGSGTITFVKNAEPRYSASGVISKDDDAQNALEKLSGSMAGQFIFNSGDPIRIMAGRYVSPTVTLDEDDIIGSIKVTPQKPRRERFNRVIGVYSDPTNLWQPSNYKAIQNGTYETDDGESITLAYDLPFCTRSAAAQRIAKIAIEEMRQEVRFTARFKLTAMQLRAHDTVMITNTRFGWSSKVFLVTDWKFGNEEQDGAMTPYIEMTLKETAAGIFDWNFGEETSKDLAPNTNLPNPFDIEAVTGIAFFSNAVETRDGDIFYNISISWDAHPNSYVTQDGKFEIEFKLSDEATYKAAAMPDGASTNSFVVQASVGSVYDIRMRAISNLGVTSNYTYLLNAVAGSGGGVTATNDWGAYVGDAISVSSDWGAFVGDAVTVTDDWGTFL